MTYDPAIKVYICTSCGRMYTQSQLIEAKERLYSSLSDEDEKRRKKRKDVLKWYLSDKEEK
jgi:lipopolysaccharide biosynthesis regulator YciM